MLLTMTKKEGGGQYVNLSKQKPEPQISKRDRSLVAIAHVI